MKQDHHKYSTKLDRNNTNFILQLFEHFKRTTWGHEYDFLKYYQNIARSFINDVDIDARGYLAYLGMGLGKSLLAVSIAIDLLKERQPIILLTKSLQENMRGAIRKYITLRKTVEPDYYLGKLSPAELDIWIEKHFSFVSMNASNMLKQMGRAAEGHSAEEFDAALEKKFGEILKLTSLDGKLLIVDEAHNLFRAITNGSKNAIGIYDMVMKAKNLKILFLTGTPIANDAFELVPCFNMLGSRDGKITLPESYKEFNKLFVDNENGKLKNKEKFQNRLLGLVSYVSHTSEPGKAFNITDPAPRAEFPTELPIIIEYVSMSLDQFVIYQLARDKEKEEGGSYPGAPFRFVETPALTKPKSRAASTYRVKSRQLSNFCPPSSFRDEKDPAKIPEEYLESPKYHKIYENIQKHKNQLGLVYSQFVGMGGLGTFSRFLNTKGWREIKITSEASRSETSRSEKTTPEASRPETNILNIDTISETHSEHESGDNEDVNNKTGRGNSDWPSSAIPTAEYMLQHIENELEQFADSTWWINDTSGDIEQDIDIEQDNDNEQDNDIEQDIDQNDPQIHITFRYATEQDLNLIKSLNAQSNYSNKDLIYPNYILLVLENNQVRGYAVVVYDISDSTESDPITICAGKIIDTYFDNISSIIGRSILYKIIADTIYCRDNPVGFRKMIWGGSVDNTGAAASNRPDRDYYYATISGNVSVEDRTRLQDLFNQDANQHGGVIDLLLISSTGAEGLDLKNGRHVHVMEPYWNWGRVKQIISRFVRNDSHKSLPDDEKNVQPYIYIAIPPDTERTPSGNFQPTTDMELYNESVVDQLTIESFNDALKEISIECMVNAESYCRKCNPTNQPLFTDDPARDVRTKDPCTSVNELNIRAEEILIDNAKYYFAEDPTSIFDYRIYIFDENINGYRPLPESDPNYIKIIDKIVKYKTENNNAHIKK